MQTSMVVFISFVLDWKYPFFGVNLVQTIEIVSLTWKFEPTIIHKIFETNSSFHVK